LADGPQRTVDKLLQPEADVAAFNRAQDNLEAPDGDADSAQGLRAWWLRRMLQTPQPLLEKLTLFWHSHFGISTARVKFPHLMLRHVQRLRRQALGRFEELLAGSFQDPAVLLGLEAGANRKAAPSQHYARTVLECFTVGPGQFGDRDVRELSRALTGWFVLRVDLRYIAREHDEGEKQVLGQRGAFDAPGVARVLAARPATARFLVKKLYRWFVSETEEPSDALLKPLTEAFAKDQNVGGLVGTILRSNQFYSTAAYRQRIKSPLEFAVGLIRSLEGLVDTLRLGQDIADLGQSLYDPPTVHGWPDGPAWANPALLVGRHNVAAALLSETGPYAGRLNPAAVAAKHGAKDLAGQATLLLDLFLQSDVPESVRESLLAGVRQPPAAEAARRARQFAHRLATLPEYHLA
jgi:uncharacterized protein (DUF1800 family)